ncbi:DUF1048 domain-containing protein [Microbacterium invictum]|uniref:DUF1048 domain-containing protein n=2 Tax=Microbacterium invictum TaxID=515415 RepID=A0ABZ0VEP0_9MICO|nr:DUF1048 domain-containing protein [Microbacterium invictum]WQB72103.1 DUF1048 domain-containing protein [Microbacterium invictum]
MMTNWIEWVTGSLADKRRWRAYRARVEALPAPYRTAAKGVERYLMYNGGTDQGELLLQMFDDLAELFEGAAADGTPVREIVGDDPVEFVDTFKSNYGIGSWITKEQKRLTAAIEQAEKEETS